jgi:hypothetical protein
MCTWLPTANTVSTDMRHETASFWSGSAGPRRRWRTVAPEKPPAPATAFELYALFEKNGIAARAT